MILAHDLAEILKSYPNYKVVVTKGFHAEQDVEIRNCWIDHLREQIKIG